MQWSGNGNPSHTEYEINRSTDGSSFFPVPTSTLELSYFDFNLLPLTSYWYRVRARNGAGVFTDYDVVVCSRTQPAQLLKPNGFCGAAVSTSSIKWNWASVSGASSYLFYDSSSGTLLTSLAGCGTTTWIEHGLSANTAVTRYLKSENPDLTSEMTEQIRVYTLANAPCVTSIVPVSSVAISVQWSVNGNPVGTEYEIQRSTDGVSYSLINQATTTTYFDFNLSPLTSYWYRVRAKNGDGIATNFCAPAVAVTAPRQIGLYSISGYVKGKRGAGIKGITMILCQGSDGTVPHIVLLTTATDAGGYYRFSDLEEGYSYSIKPKCNGHKFDTVLRSTGQLCCDVPGWNFTGEKVSHSITISPDESAVLDIDLPSGGTARLEIGTHTFTSTVVLTLSTTSVPSGDAGRNRLTDLGVEIDAAGSQPLKDMSFTVSYMQSDIGLLDKTKLAIARYDTASSRWVVMPSSGLPGQNTVVARLNHLCAFALMQVVPAGNMDSINVYPNPFNPAKCANGLVIDNLTSGAAVKIYTVAGSLVRELIDDDGDGRIVWDGRNEYGTAAASGIYIGLADGKGRKKLKIAIER
jgi:hypothetical protein